MPQNYAWYGPPEDMPQGYHLPTPDELAPPATQNTGVPPQDQDQPPPQNSFQLGSRTGTGPNDQFGNPITTQYNQNLFADDPTTQRLAQQYGGTPSSAPLREAGGGTPGSPFNMPNANYITMPNGSVVNAGQIAQWQNTGQENLIKNEMSDKTAAAEAQPSGASYWYGKYAPDAVQDQQHTIAQQQQPQGGAAPNTGGPTQAPPFPRRSQAMRNTGAVPQGGRSMGTLPPGGRPQPRPTPSNADGNSLPPFDPTTTPPPSSGGPGGLTRGILPGGYGTGTPGPMPYGSGAIGGFPVNANGTPAWGYKPSTNVGDVLANDRSYAYAQGGELLGNYGEGMAQQDQRARQLGAVGDQLYANLQQNPGYTPDQASGILNQGGLDEVGWNQNMADSNFLTPGEETSSRGDPYQARNTYNGQVENLRQDARNYGNSMNGIYDNGATDLNGAVGGMRQRMDNSIDGSKLGLSDEYNSTYNFGPQDQQALIDDAGRTVGQGTSAVTDQLQRNANAAGTNAPLALAAAEDRMRQTGAVASADAMTKAKIQAKQLGLNVEQSREQARLGTEQDIASRRMQAAQAGGQADIGAQEFLTAGRANAGLETGRAQLEESNRIAEQQTGLTGAAEAAQAQRAQAIAQNRQQINAANQAQQFQRGSYRDTAASQRNTQMAGASRADQTQARQDVRNEEQTGYNEANSRMAGQLQAFSGVTGAGGASQANAIRAAQLPTTLDKVIGAAAGAAGGAGGTNFADGGVVDEPTVARVGEKGPEIVIKLKNMNGSGGPMGYRRRNEAAYAA